MNEPAKRELEDWEKRFLQERLQLKNYRGRRLQACDAVGTLRNVIENLDVDDGSQLPIPYHTMPTPPTSAQKRELANMAALLLRMILLANDGQISSDTLNGF